MYSVYVLKNAHNRLYIGHTGDLNQRLNQHNFGYGGREFTHGKGPWQMIHWEDYPTRTAAMKRERGLKSGRGRAWLKKKFVGIASA